MMSTGKHKPHWAQAQLWSVTFAAIFLCPTWIWNGGYGRLVTAVSHPETGMPFIQLIVVNGLM